jgi:protein-L-isoaspartate(D-aspartate) O-methyltransferase
MVKEWLARIMAGLQKVHMPHEMRRDKEPQVSPWLHGWPEIHDERVRAAFTRVPREAFVDEEMRPWALYDTALPIGEGQTISQPYVVALMTQSLDLKPGLRVLEIGTGSGYQTAILCELTSRVEEVRGNHVWSIERNDTLSLQAATLLNKLGYWPHLVTGDGAAGWPAAAPFDGILVTAAASAVPRPLWDQLADGGRMVIPIGSPNRKQTLWLVTREGRTLVRQSLGGVRFVPFVSDILNDAQQRIELRDT